MIDETRTLELFGYTSDSLSHGSEKKICAVCDECGKVRFLPYSGYRKLCRECSPRSKETRKKLSEARKGKKLSDEAKRKVGEANKGKKHSDEARKNMSEAQKGKKLSDETKRKIGEANKGKKLSDEHRQKISEAKKNPSDETRLKMSEANKGRKYSDEAKKNMGKAWKGKKFSDAHRQKISEAQRGEKHYNWRGGVSFEPYCPKFNEAFKESIREKFGRICFLCPKTEVENGKKLDVHHVNHDKNCLCDDVKCEFVPLCVSCHSKTNFNQEYWENLIIDKLKDNSQLLDQFRNK